MTQQFPFLFQYLKKQRINIDRNEFDFQVQSHPSYPSLLSISDTLSFFKINNIAARPESTHQLPDDFIALLNNEGSGQFLAFVEKKQNGYRYTKEQKATDLSVEDFNKMFEDIVLVAESSEKATLKPRKRILSISLAILSLLYLAAAFAEGFNLPVFMFILLASAGLYLSIQAVSHELGINTKFSEAFCSLTEDTDCDAVINSVKSNFFAFLNFSNISISFFAGQLFSLLLFSITGQLQSLYDLTFISLLCSLPVTAISIYMQIFIVKKWCPLCLSIIFLLFAETASLFFLNDFQFLLTTRSIVYFSLTFISSFIISVNVKNLLKANFELKSKSAELIRFKRTYSVFKAALLNSDKVNPLRISSENIILGNPTAKFNLIVVTSPFCGYCEDAHKILEEILELFHDKICIQIRFNFNADRSDERSKTVHQKLVQIYLDKGGDQFMKAMHDWFSEKDITKLNHYTDGMMNETAINAILSEHYSWNKQNNASFTPAFIINHYHLPSQYNREDLIHFINDLADDEHFL